MLCLGGGCKKSPRGRRSDGESCRGGDRRQDGGDIDARAEEGCGCVGMGAVAFLQEQSRPFDVAALIFWGRPHAQEDVPWVWGRGTILFGGAIFWYIGWRWWCWWTWCGVKVASASRACGAGGAHMSLLNRKWMG